MKQWMKWTMAAALMIGLLCASLARGNAHVLPRDHYAVPSGRSFDDWNAVFALGNTVELRTLDTGQVHIARSKMLSPTHELTARYVEESEPLHVFAHLVRHPSAGDVLIDAGLDASFVHDRFGNISMPLRWILDFVLDAPYSQTEGSDVISQLQQAGAQPHTVFLTHLHMDHTAGIPSLGGHIRVVTGMGEADDAFQYVGTGHFASGTTLFELDFARANDMPPLGPSIDVFGDGALWAISTPGHSKGHVSFVVNAADGPVLLTGDASHFDWAFEHGVGPSGTDESGAQRSLDRLRTFASQFPQIRIHTGHQAMRPVGTEASRHPGSALRSD